MLVRNISAVASILLIFASAPVFENTAESTSVKSSIASQTNTQPVITVPEDTVSDFAMVDLPPTVRTIPVIKSAPPVTAPIQTPAPEIPPAPNPVPTQPPTPTPMPPVAPAPVAPDVRYIHVGLSGGQETLDLGRGPVLYSEFSPFGPYVAEHDFAGGWERFGTLSAGMTVTMTGLVNGTYTVGQIINVPKGGTTDELLAFGEMPKVFLQTCIPGTTRMIVVGLY